MTSRRDLPSRIDAINCSGGMLFSAILFLLPFEWLIEWLYERPATIYYMHLREDTQFQTSRATSTTRLSFAFSSSRVSGFPPTVLAKPHCGEIPRFSSGTNFAA